MFTALTRGAVGGRLCPWQRGPLPRSRLGGGVPMAGTPRCFQLATGLWLQTRTRRGILPYRGFQHRLRFAWTTVHAVLTLAPLVTGLGRRSSLRRLFTPLGCCRPPFQSRGRSRRPSSPSSTWARGTPCGPRSWQRLTAHIQENVQMVERVLVKQVRLVEQEDRVDAVAAEVFDVGADRVEARRSQGAGGGRHPKSGGATPRSRTSRRISSAGPWHPRC